MEATTLNWNTIIVSIIMAAPMTMFILKLHRDIVSKSIPKGFADIVAVMEKSLDRAEDRHQEHLLAMAAVEHAVAKCRYGGKIAKKHAQNAPSRRSDGTQKGKSHRKKRSPRKGKPPRRT